MKKILFTISFCLFASFIFAQKAVALKYTKDSGLYLNTTKLDNSLTIDDISTILGTPTIFKEYKYTGKINYHYAGLGISVHTVKGKLLFIGTNFNWDGDKTFPETSYAGALEIDGVHIHKESGEAVIKDMPSVKFIPSFMGLFVTADKDTKTPILIGFKEDKVTQVGFEFH